MKINSWPSLDLGEEGITSPRTRRHLKYYGCLFLAFYLQAYLACFSRDCSQFVAGWSTSLCPIRLHEQRTRCLLKLVYPGPNSTLSLGFSLWVPHFSLSGSCDSISKFVDCLVPVWDTIIKRTVALCISETYCVKGPMG